MRRTTCCNTRAENSKSTCRRATHRGDDPHAVLLLREHHGAVVRHGHWQLLLGLWDDHHLLRVDLRLVPVRHDGRRAAPQKVCRRDFCLHVVLNVKFLRGGGRGQCSVLREGQRWRGGRTEARQRQGTHAKVVAEDRDDAVVEDGHAFLVGRDGNCRDLSCVVGGGIREKSKKKKKIMEGGAIQGTWSESREGQRAKQVTSCSPAQTQFGETGTYVHPGFRADGPRAFAVNNIELPVGGSQNLDNAAVAGPHCNGRHFAALLVSV